MCLVSIGAPLPPIISRGARDRLRTCFCLQIFSLKASRDLTKCSTRRLRAVNPDICWIRIKRQRAQNKASAFPPLYLVKCVLVKKSFYLKTTCARQSRVEQPRALGEASGGRRGVSLCQHPARSLCQKSPLILHTHGDPLQSPVPTEGQNHTSACPPMHFR